MYSVTLGCFLMGCQLSWYWKWEKKQEMVPNFYQNCLFHFVFLKSLWFNFLWKHIWRLPVAIINQSGTNIQTGLFPGGVVSSGSAGRQPSGVMVAAKPHAYVQSDYLTGTHLEPLPSVSVRSPPKGKPEFITTRVCFSQLWPSVTWVTITSRSPK